MAAYDDQLSSLVLEDVEVTGKELGRGAYGVVYEVRVNGLVCAGKKLYDVIVSEYSQKYFTEECLLHSQLRHPNIVQFIGIHYPQGSTVPMLIMEYLPLSLRHCLETTPHLLPDVKYSILLDVASGLNYLHSRRPPIIHCNLTANSILLTLSYTAKICDFGGSIKYYSREQDLVICPGIQIAMPPEALVQDDPRYDHKLDVFSYGCLILSVLTHQWPIIPSDQLPREARVSEWDRRSEYTSLIPTASDHPLLHFTKSCLENDPHNRPNMSDAIKCIQGITQEANLVKDSGDTSFQLHGTDFEEIDTYCKPHLSDLCMVLKPVSPRYQHIGILLGVPMDALGLNPLLNHDDNLSTTLQWWLNNGDNPTNGARSVTWGNIIDVIENGLPNYKVAEEMREFLRKRAKSKKLMPDTSASSRDDEQAEATEVDMTLTVQDTNPEAGRRRKSCREYCCNCTVI